LELQCRHSHGSQESAKRTCHGGRGDEDADAEEKLIALVEARDEESKTRHDSALKHPEHGSRSQQALEAVHKRTAQGNEAKPHDQHRQIVLGPDLLQQQVAGHLDEHVDDIEDGRHPVESVAGEAEVPGHALDTRVADIDAGGFQA